MTGFAVAWGIFILVVLLGASNGLKNGIQESYGSKVTNMVTINAGWTSMPYKGFKEDRELFWQRYREQDFEKIAVDYTGHTLKQRIKWRIKELILDLKQRS